MSVKRGTTKNCRYFFTNAMKAETIASDSYDLLTLSGFSTRKIRRENSDESGNRGKYFNFISILYEECDN